MTPGRPAVQLADQNWATSQAARATIASFTAAVRAAQIVVGLQEEALTGTRTVLDVLVDEQQRFTTQAQLVTAERDTAIAEFTRANSRKTQAPAQTRCASVATGHATAVGMVPTLCTPMPLRYPQVTNTK